MAAELKPLPHQHDAAERLRSLLATVRKPGLCLLTGPSGSGKSWLAAAVSESFHAGGPEPLPLLVVQGQHTLQGTPLACWRLALYGRRSRFARPGAYQEIAQETMRAASKVTLGLSEVVNIALGARKQFRNAPATLNDEQFGILHELAVLAHNQTAFVLIADNLQWWDEQSIVLLRALFLPAFVDNFPFLLRSQVIGVLRKEAERSSVVERLIHDLRPPTVTLEMPDLAASEAALRQFGVVDAGPQIAVAIHAATGGHLQLLREVARYLHSSSGSPRAGVAGVWSSECRRDFLRDSIRERLASSDMGAALPASFQLLEAAATIGIAFTEAALRCMTRDDTVQYERALSVLTSLGILERNGSLIRFAHEILQEATASDSPGRRSELHERFADCLRLLNPTDYDARSFHLDCAGRTEDAQVMAILAALSQLRNGVGGSTADHQAPLGTSVSAASKLLDEATRRWFANEYPQVIELLTSFPTDVPELLSAERAYLVADSLLKSIEAGDRAAVIDLLEDWRGKVVDEFEIWFRLSATLMVARSHVGALDAARAIEREIIGKVDKRRQYDPAAVVYAHTLYRKSDALHEVEVVARRQQEAVRFFRGDVSIQAPRHPSEYARAAANLIGSLLVLGEYASASELADDLIAWLSTASGGLLPRATVALNNLLLVRLLSGTATPAEVVPAFEDLLAAAARAEDRLLIASNLSVARARSGDLRGALGILEQCDRSLGLLYRPDPYYVYFVRSNLTAIRFHGGALPDPLSAWSQLEPQLVELHQPLRPFLCRRHELLATAFSDISPGDITGWDDYLQTRHPRQLGRPWTFYGRGFLLTDIQHWSDG
jgi:hypothetical protein